MIRPIATLTVVKLTPKDPITSQRIVNIAPKVRKKGGENEKKPVLWHQDDQTSLGSLIFRKREGGEDRSGAGLLPMTVAECHGFGTSELRTPNPQQQQRQRNCGG